MAKHIKPWKNKGGKLTLLIKLESYIRVLQGLWWSRRVVGHVRRRPAHVRHGVRCEVVAILASMRLRLPRSQQDD